MLKPDPSIDDFPADPLEQIRWALDDHDFARVEKAIAEGLELDALVDDDGDSPLHNAAQKGDLAVVDFYLRHGCPRTLDTFDYIGHTPLIRAAANGQATVTANLLAAGANPNAHNEPRIGNTAIREAVRGGHAEIVRLLLAAGADPAIPGWMQVSALDQAKFEVETGLHSPEAVAIRKMLAPFMPPQMRREWESPGIHGTHPPHEDHGIPSSPSP